MNYGTCSALALAALTILSVDANAQARSTAVYEVRFDATWSNQTHPGAYPGNAHFSPLIGGTHSASGQFWQAGGIASNGMEVMAETGNRGPLRNEVEAAIANGLAGEVILGVGIDSPDSTTTTFTVTDEFPLVTLVTMIAPSPDWFIGTESLALLENGVWRDEVVANLYAWDSGTDSGMNFNSGNQNTNPAEPIELVLNGPFFAAVPLGTMTFTRQSSTLILGCGLNPEGSLEASCMPTLGQTVDVTLDDPTGLYPTPAASFLFVSTRAAAPFPCGRLLPGFGLGAAGSDGELLLGRGLTRSPGPAFNGTGVTFPFTIPNDPLLVSERFYLQGAFLASGRVGLTEGLELFIGN